VALPDSFMPGFSMCPGGPGSAFPFYASSFLQGQQQVNWYAQSEQGAALASFTDGTCVPVAVLGMNTPIGGGAFGMTVVGGQAGAPPAGWAPPPSACNM
jgi:hypothetical protein